VSITGARTDLERFNGDVTIRTEAAICNGVVSKQRESDRNSTGAVTKQRESDRNSTGVVTKVKRSQRGNVMDL
jgi:hypothetical protein